MKNEDPSEVDRRARLFICAFVCAMIGSCVAFHACGAKADDETPTISMEWSLSRAEYERKITTYLGEFFAKSNPKNLDRAIALVPVVLDVCESEHVNPALISAMITLESTWYPTARGNLGELGLMQVNGSNGGTPREQLIEGIGVLKHAFDVCGTTSGAVSYYATGKSCQVYRGARLRLRIAAHIESL